MASASNGNGNGWGWQAYYDMGNNYWSKIKLRGTLVIGENWGAKLKLAGYEEHWQAQAMAMSVDIIGIGAGARLKLLICAIKLLICEIKTSHLRLAYNRSFVFGVIVCVVIQC